MTKSPELIYEGSFSDKVLNIKPKGLGNKKVNLEEVKKLALDFVGKDNQVRLQYWKKENK